MKKAFFLSVVFVIFILPSKIFADSLCQQADPCAGKQLADQPACYQSVVDSCKNQRETLSSQINLMNNQIRLTTLKIENTKDAINKLTGEISELSDEVARLETILNQRSVLLLHRIPESYKRASISPFSALFLSINFSDFLTRAKYLMKVTDEDANLLLQVKATQNNFSERKTLREDKKVEQQKAQRQLEGQNIELTQQKEAKDALLTQTQGQEQTYIQLRAQALAQLASFGSFVDQLGAIVLSHQTVCNDWGCYYNQRDSQWAGGLINGQGSGCGANNGPCTILRVGCLVTSLAMMVSHLGRKDILPSDIAFSSPVNFSVGTASLMQGTIYVKGSGITRTAIASSLNPSLLQNGVVIVGVKYGYFGTHFVVVKSYDPNSKKYIMNDPYTEGGHDKVMDDYYPVSSVFEVDRVTM